MIILIKALFIIEAFYNILCGVVDENFDDLFFGIFILIIGIGLEVI